MEKLSPQKAADRVKVSRRTIMVGIEDGSLKALRNNRNNWVIDPEELERWADTKGFSGDDGSEHETSDTDDESITEGFTETSLELARLEERLKAKDAKIEDLESQLVKRDADYERAMELLREAQQPWWVRFGKALKG